MNKNQVPHGYMHRDVARRPIPRDHKKEQADAIIHIVSKMYRVRRDQIFQHHRYPMILEPRQVAMWLMWYIIKGITLEEIARYFVMKHTTVINARDKIDSIMDVDKYYRYEMCEIYLKTKDAIARLEEIQNKRTVSTST